jgi:hypothetical protein
MNKLHYLKQVKALLKSIIAQRKYLLVNNAGHLDSQFAKQEIANIDHALPNLVDADRAKQYIERKETALRYLIPANNHRRHEELRQLIETSLN